VQATTNLLEKRGLTDIAARSWTYVTLGYDHGEEWSRAFCYRPPNGGPRGWLSIEHEDVMLSRREGLTKSVAFLKSVAASEASDYAPQEF
jgi:hypothetical protein